VNAYRDRAIINVAAFLRSLGVGLMGVVLGIYLSRSGHSAFQIGAVLAFGLAGSACATTLVGIAADRVGRKQFLVLLRWIAWRSWRRSSADFAASFRSSVAPCISTAFCRILRVVFDCGRALLASLSCDRGQRRFESRTRCKDQPAHQKDHWEADCTIFIGLFWRRISDGCARVLLVLQTVRTIRARSGDCLLCSPSVECSFASWGCMARTPNWACQYHGIHAFAFQLTTDSSAVRAICEVRDLVVFRSGSLSGDGRSNAAIVRRSLGCTC